MFYDGQVFYGSDVRVSCSTTFAKLICIPKYVLMHLLLRFCTFMIKNCPFTLIRESGVATAYLLKVSKSKKQFMVEIAFEIYWPLISAIVPILNTHPSYILNSIELLKSNKLKPKGLGVSISKSFANSIFQVVILQECLISKADDFNYYCLTNNVVKICSKRI